MLTRKHIEGVRKLMEQTPKPIGPLEPPLEKKEPSALTHVLQKPRHVLGCLSRALKHGAMSMNPATLTPDIHEAFNQLDTFLSSHSNAAGADQVSQKTILSGGADVETQAGKVETPQPVAQTLSPSALPPVQQMERIARKAAEEWFYGKGVRTFKLRSEAIDALALIIQRSFETKGQAGDALPPCEPETREIEQDSPPLPLGTWKCDVCGAPATRRSETFLYCEQDAPKNAEKILLSSQGVSSPVRSVSLEEIQAELRRAYDLVAGTAFDEVAGIISKQREAIDDLFERCVSSPVTRVESEALGTKEADVNAGDASKQKWLPIESAPKDGTVIDLLYNDRRWTDCFWGKPEHSCGEAGEYCDSDWHHIRHPGWVYSLFDEFLQGEPTHWMPPPSVPDGTEKHPVAPLSENPAASPVSSVERDKKDLGEKTLGLPGGAP